MRRSYFKLRQIRSLFLTTGDGGRSRFKRSYKWRRVETGGVWDCRSKQDTYKRMSASRIRRNVRRAEVKVSAVFAVVYRKTKRSESKRIGRPNPVPSGRGAEICACMEIDACQPVYDSTLTACIRVSVSAGTSKCVFVCRAVTNELCLICR